jgi:hypothetical protein
MFIIFDILIIYQKGVNQMSLKKIQKEIRIAKKRKSLIKELSEKYANGLNNMGCKFVWAQDVKWVFENESLKELYQIKKRWVNLEKIRKGLVVK